MSRPRDFRQRPLAWLAAAVTALATLSLCLPSTALETAEQITLDLRFRLRGTQPTSSDSVIVGVADSSFNQPELAPTEATREPLLDTMARPWPWDRRIFAEVVRRLRAAGARAIVFDVVFAGPNSGDTEFARVLAEPGAPVILASLWQENHSAVGEGTVTLLEPHGPLLAAHPAYVGYANVWPAHDGVLRALTATKRPSDFLGSSPDLTEAARPSLALAAARTLQPATPAIGGYIDFLGPAGTVPALPVEDLFLPDRWTGPWLRSGELFRNRVVWIGPLSEVRFKDYYATPFGRMSGVETQAQAFATLLASRPLVPFSPVVSGVASAFLAAAGLLLTFRLRRIAWQLGLLVTGATVWLGGAFVCFTTAGLIVPVVAPLAAWIVAGGSGLAAGFIAEQRERRRLRAVLGRYVSEEVAQIIADQPDDFSQALRGRRRPVTVLFADLRGFTTWAETAEPEVFVAQLNEYFRAVVDCVLAEGGTLQKFIGDAVLAVWGDTRTAGTATDAARALDAALAMQAAVTRLNLAWAGRPDRIPFAIGIGLHHGVAMVGNVGHPQRMEFTVLGDVVNTASRLESANRQLGTGLLVSDALRELTADTHRFVPLGRVVLKGKRESVALFTPAGPAAAPAVNHALAKMPIRVAWRTRFATIEVSTLN